MNVFRSFLTVLLIGFGFCSSISDSANVDVDADGINENASFDPVLEALINGPNESFKRFLQSNYFNERGVAQVNQAFKEFSTNPELSEEAEQTVSLNIIKAFGLITNYNSPLEFTEQHSLTITSYVDMLARESFRLEISNLLKAGWSSRLAEAKTSTKWIIQNSKAFFPFDQKTLKNLEIIEVASRKLMDSAMKKLTNIDCSFSNYIKGFADQIILEACEAMEALEEVFDWMDLSDDLDRVRVISEALDETQKYTFCAVGMNKAFVLLLLSLYSDLYEEEFSDFPDFNYHWKAFEHETPYLKVLKPRREAFKKFSKILQYKGVIKEGINSAVFQYFDKYEQKMFACKCIRSTNEFNRERETSKYLDHPYFVKSFGYKAETKLVFYEYIDGMRSDEYSKTATAKQLKLMAAQLFLSLEYLHAIRIVHGDLKPSNVLIARDGTVKIIDFGLSFNPPIARVNVGTCTTMAPELLKCAPGEINEAIDWWSYGVTVAILFGFNPEFNDDHGFGFLPIFFDSDLFKFVVQKVPSKFPEDLRHFLSIFLQPDPEYRCFNTPRQLQKLRDHPFFGEIDWSELEGGILGL